MKNLIKPGIQVLFLFVILIVSFGVTVYFKVAPDLANDRDTPAVARLQAMFPSVFGEPPIIETKRVAVDIIFESEDEKYKYTDIEVFSVTTRNSHPIEVIANANIINSLIDNLPEPSNALKHVPAKISSRPNEFDRLITDTEGLKLDREKIKHLLKEKIKDGSMSEKIRVPMIMTTYRGRENVNYLMSKMGFNTVIGSYTALHEGYVDNEERNVNLQVAAERSDGIIMPPGGRFSFNRIVGARTRDNGFMKAGVISQGRTIQGLGGGICQVSTALYIAALRAGLEIDERHNHSIYDGLDYSPLGLDSAVAWGYKDFRFANNLDFPILISAKAGKGIVKVEIFAEKKPYDEIIIETRNEQKHPFRTETRTNSSLEPGQVRVVHPGVTGYTIESYRTITRNGSKTEQRLARDRYLTYNRIEEVNN